MGVGMVLATPHSQASKVVATLKRKGEKPVVIGDIVRSKARPGVIYTK